MKYRIAYSVPDLSGDRIHTTEMCGNIEDTWTDVRLAGAVWDLNVWQNDGPIRAGLYPVSVDENGKRIIDTTMCKVVVLHSVRCIDAVGHLGDELLNGEVLVSPTVHITLTQENKEDFSPAHLCARRIMGMIHEFQILSPTSAPDHAYPRGLRHALDAMVEFELIKGFDEKRNIIEPVQEVKGNE